MGNRVFDPLDDGQRAVVDQFRDFVRINVRPNAVAWDESQAMDRGVIAELADKGWLGALAPREYGGQNMDPFLWGDFGAENSAIARLGLWPNIRGICTYRT